MLVIYYRETPGGGFYKVTMLVVDVPVIFYSVDRFSIDSGGGHKRSKT